MNSDNRMQLKVVTPTGTMLEERAVSVAMWTELGQIEVLHGHAPTVVLLVPGEMRIYDGVHADRILAAGEGFAQIDGVSVTVFSDMAEEAANIALDQTEEAKHRAETALAQAANMTEDERQAADLVVKESLVKIQVSMRRKDGSRQRGPVPRQ